MGCVGLVVFVEACLYGAVGDAEPSGEAVHGDPFGAGGYQLGGDSLRGFCSSLVRFLVGVPGLADTAVAVLVVLVGVDDTGRVRTIRTTRVLQVSAWADLDDRWPFDLPPDTAIFKTEETPRSAGQNFAGKREAAREHAQALQLRHPDRIDGVRVVIYDDICTTGLQLNRVAQRLREWGAASVHGIVLARQPWR